MVYDMTHSIDAQRVRPRLQVALDCETLDDALALAKKVAPFVDILEAGTPLIKAEGMWAVSALKETHKDKMICADLKTADAGYLEVRLAAQAGADIVTVLADAYDETLLEALRAAHDFHVEIMADLIMSRLPISRLADIIGIRFKETEIHYACVHSGLDKQATRQSPLSELASVTRLRDRPRLAVAGGIRASDIPRILAYPVEIVIVGGGITRAKYPVKAAKVLQNAIQKKPKTRK
jgi:3-hexulose-6-phosphate synthase